MSEESKKTFWQHVTGWGVVAFVSSLSLGSGVGMTSSHPYIADTFFFVGFAFLLVKFWAWEEAKHDTHRKTAILLAGVTVLVILLFGGSCWLSYYLNLPKPKADESASNPQQAPKHIENSKTIEAPQDVPPSLTASMRPLHHHVVPKSSSEPSSNPQTAPPPTYGGQTCIGSACAQGPNSQATFNQFGPPRLELTDAQSTAITNAMKPYPGSSIIVLLPNHTSDSYEYGVRLANALKTANLNAYPHTLMTTAPCAPGISFFARKDFAFIEPLKAAMESSGAARGNVKVGPGWIDPADLYIWVCPY